MTNIIRNYPSKANNMFYCEYCDKSVMQIHLHSRTKKHKMNGGPVVNQREQGHSPQYHRVFCEYCNIIIEGSITKHEKTSKHCLKADLPYIYNAVRQHKCDLCDVITTSRWHHDNTILHIRNERAAKGLDTEPADLDEYNVRNRHVKLTYCDVCSVEVKYYDLHLTGKKHKAAAGID